MCVCFDLFRAMVSVMQRGLFQRCECDTLLLFACHTRLVLSFALYVFYYCKKCEHGFTCKEEEAEEEAVCSKLNDIYNSSTVLDGNIATCIKLAIEDEKVVQHLTCSRLSESSNVNVCV